MGTSSFVQDTINFTIQAAMVVVSDTVRITTTVSVSTNSKTSETDLRSDIKGALNKLIPNADWAFSGMSRYTDQAGLELVQINATTRVDEKENYKLSDRARAASREGLTLSEPQVDNSVPGPKIEEAELLLRRDLIKKINTEIESIKELTGDYYRIGSLIFSNVNQLPKANMMTPTAYHSSVGTTLEAGDDGLSNSQRISLNASVELRRVVPIYI